MVPFSGPPKVGYQHTLAGILTDKKYKSTLYAGSVGVEHASRKAHLSLGLMVDVRVMFCTVVPIVVGSFFPVCLKLALCLSAAQPVESQIPKP